MDIGGDDGGVCCIGPAMVLIARGMANAAVGDAGVGVGVGGGGCGVKRLLQPPQLLLEYHRWPCLEESGYRVSSHSLRNDLSNRTLRRPLRASL